LGVSTNRSPHFNTDYKSALVGDSTWGLGIPSFKKEMESLSAMFSLLVRICGSQVLGTSGKINTETTLAERPDS